MANSTVSLCFFSASNTLTWRFGKRPFNSLAAFRARSRLSNSFLAWPSTTKAYRLVGRPTKALEIGAGGAGVLVRCVRCWRIGNSDVGDQFSKRIRPRIVPRRSAACHKNCVSRGLGLNPKTICLRRGIIPFGRQPSVEKLGFAYLAGPVDLASLTKSRA